jgi:hypothetical protein
LAEHGLHERVGKYNSEYANSAASVTTGFHATSGFVGLYSTDYVYRQYVIGILRGFYPVHGSGIRRHTGGPI